MGGKSSQESSTNPREFILKNAVFLAIAAAVIALAAFAFVTDAPAYAGTASATCANCHVMDSMYENYYHAAHHAWAVCADCHLPHTELVTYYFRKGPPGNARRLRLWHRTNAPGDPHHRAFKGDRPAELCSLP